MTMDAVVTMARDCSQPIPWSLAERACSSRRGLRR